MAITYDLKEMRCQKEIFERRIAKKYPNEYAKCVFCYGDPLSPGHNVPKDTTAQYVICLFPNKNVFIVWNHALHRKYKDYGAAQGSLNLNWEWDGVLFTNHTITFPYYKKMGTRKDSPYEKVYVVHVDDWQMFFANLDTYMCFNEFDTDTWGKPLNSQIIEQEDSSFANETLRKCYSSRKLQRKADFRTQVLEAYQNQCAICRCSIIKILQAAHLHGYEVADSDLSADKSENGICLCANHHLMYDSDLIDIDVKKNTIQVFDETVKRMPWYNLFEENGFRLVERKKEM